MNLRLPCLTAAALLVATAAFGQSPFPPVGSPQPQAQPSPFPPISGQQPQGQPSPFPPISGQQIQQPLYPPFTGRQSQQQPPCMDNFMKLRGETEKRGKLIQAASKRKAPPVEACNLITSYLEADQQMISFVETNARSCGIPPNIPADMKKNHAGVQQLRGRICEAAERHRPIPIRMDPPLWKLAPAIKRGPLPGILHIAFESHQP